MVIFSHLLLEQFVRYLQKCNTLHMDFDNTIITIASNTFCLESFRAIDNGTF